MSQLPNPSFSPAHRAYEENRRAVEHVREQLKKLREKMHENQETLATLDHILDEIRSRRTPTALPAILEGSTEAACLQARPTSPKSPNDF